MRRLLGCLAALAVLGTGCAAPADDDGEVLAAGRLAAAPAESDDARAVVVDTDLGGDDLVALSLSLIHI